MVNLKQIKPIEDNVKLPSEIDKKRKRRIITITEFKLMNKSIIERAIGVKIKEWGELYY